MPSHSTFNQLSFKTLHFLTISNVLNPPLLMAGHRSDYITGAAYSPRASARPIPKRGQVKLGIMVGLAHTVASIFSPTTRRT
ncbi:hypothetical protein E6C27_scaffold120G003310 [Cucumis melo var. makuwa]|uniref:Uncharacterized protein n=2 Tax=Cucumis melo TaxID=3656 RepID=A0A5A7UBX7_CUCMM|nr:hypothetical protein E6C27_scaffold120G003310 [Cucumis melo var. makuwa]